MSQFEELIQKLGTILDISLQAEKETLCKMLFDGVTVQIEHLSSTDEVLIISYLCEVPPGAFRIETLVKALRENGSPHAFGSFSFLDKHSSLVLELHLPSSITAEALSDHFYQFIAKARDWKEAVLQGNLSLVSSPSKSFLPPPFSG
jgi:hypothetical protein